VEFAVSLAEEYEAHLTLLHVVEGRLPTSLQFAVEFAQRRLRQALPPEVDLRFKPALAVETGSAADSIVNLTADLSADIIVNGGTRRWSTLAYGESIGINRAQSCFPRPVPGADGRRCTDLRAGSG
jgi:nucleotide-binding universal stress UspA family protein